jgi:DHA1 family purine base/nucleoside efflux pump-like MFS transporter
MIGRVIRLSIALFLVQAGFHGFTASIPLALARAGRPDPEIGAIVGIAAVVQIGGALVGGVLIDRFGMIRLFVLGGLCYAVSAALLVFSGVGPDSLPGLVAARVLQGAGGGLTVPAALALAPSLVPAARRGTAIAFVGSAHNLTLVILPPLSLMVLKVYGLSGVAVMVGALVLVALAVVLARPIVARSAEESHLGTATRHFGFAWRSSWLAPLAIVVLFVLHWGVLVAYLPQRAEAAGADIGLFFAADGLGVLLARIPAGWLADRIPPVWPVVIGIAMTFAAVALLFDTPTTPVLIVSGSLTGVGAALIVQPLMLSLTARSTDRDRGSVFALFNASFSISIALGTIGSAPLIQTLGFGTLLAGSLAALAASAVVAFLDGELRRPATSPELAERQIELAQEAGTPIGP